MNDASETKIGAHTVRFVPPDIVLVQWDGPVSGEEIQGIGSEIRRLNREDFFVLLDAKNLGAVSMNAKKSIREIPMARGVAIFGASTQVRILLSLLTKVYVMVYRGADTPIRFYETEAEALDWFEQQRRSGPATP